MEHTVEFLVEACGMSLHQIMTIIRAHTRNTPRADRKKSYDITYRTTHRDTVKECQATAYENRKKKALALGMTYKQYMERNKSSDNEAES
jgi:hypothetical protein